MVRAFFYGLGPNMIFVMVIVLTLLLGLMAGLLANIARRMPSCAIIVGMAFLLIGAFTSGFDADHPQPSNLFYIKNEQAAQTLWVSDDEQLNSWNRQFFPGTAQRQKLPAMFGDNAGLFWTSPAPEFGISAPTITVLSEQREAKLHRLEIEVKSLRLAPSFLVSIDGAKVMKSTLNGRVLNDAPRDTWSLLASGIQADGVRLMLEIEPDKAFKIRLRERSFGLPKNDYSSRPPEIIVQPFASSNSTQSVRFLDFAK